MFVTSPKPVVVKLLREFKNGPHLHSGSQGVVAAGRTRQTVVSWRPGQTSPRGLGDWVVCRYTGGSNNLNKGVNALV